MGRERDEARRAEYQMLCRRLGLIMANGLKGALTGALDRGVRRIYYDTLISMGEVSRPVIEGMITDDNRFLVRDACVMLGEIGGPRAVELVTSALADTDARVRAEALHALGELGDANAGSLALGFLEDADSNVRLAAAVTAGKLGLERALRPLLQLLEDEEDADDRVRLLQALGDLGDPGAVPAIEKHAAPGLFAKASTDVRVAAYKALHSIGTPHARELVQRAANDKEPAVRAALRGLTRED
jgi:HEAT repeat protein